MMFEHLETIIQILNQLSVGKFIVFMLVALPVVLVAMLLAVVVLCLAILIVVASIICVYEWCCSRIRDVRHWLLKRVLRSRNP